jgi:tetratricopeptide (TPR) repeat protein
MIRSLLTGWLFLFLGTLAGAQHATDQLWDLARGGKLEEAIGRAETFVLDHPDDPIGYHTLGRFFFMAGEDELAIETLSECLELKPEPAWVVAWTHDILGQALARRGETARAEEHLRRAIELDATQNCTRDAQHALGLLLGEDPWGRGLLFGKELPDFEFHGTGGTLYRREDLVDRAVILRFGPSW